MNRYRSNQPEKKSESDNLINAVGVIEAEIKKLAGEKSQVIVKPLANAFQAVMVKAEDPELLAAVEDLAVEHDLPVDRDDELKYITVYVLDDSHVVDDDPYKSEPETVMADDTFIDEPEEKAALDDGHQEETAAVSSDIDIELVEAVTMPLAAEVEKPITHERDEFSYLVDLFDQVSCHLTYSGINDVEADLFAPLKKGRYLAQYIGAGETNPKTSTLIVYKRLGKETQKLRIADTVDEYAQRFEDAAIDISRNMLGQLLYDISANPEDADELILDLARSTSDQAAEIAQIKTLLKKAVKDSGVVSTDNSLEHAYKVIDAFDLDSEEFSDHLKIYIPTDAPVNLDLVPRSRHNRYLKRR